MIAEEDAKNSKFVQYHKKLDSHFFCFIFSFNFSLLCINIMFNTL